MLAINGEVRIREGAADAVRDAIRTMEVESLKEPGCHTYAFSIDVVDPTMMRITELWESMEALEAHFGSPHMAAFGAAMAQVQPLSVTVNCWELGERRSLPGQK